MRFFLSIVLIFSALMACKSSFEQVRTSNDPKRILEESYKYYDKGDYFRAQTLMELILNQYRGTKEGEELFELIVRHSEMKRIANQRDEPVHFCRHTGSWWLSPALANHRVVMVFCRV